MPAITVRPEMADPFRSITAEFVELWSKAAEKSIREVRRYSTRGDSESVAYLARNVDRCASGLRGAIEVLGQIPNKAGDSFEVKSESPALRAAFGSAAVAYLKEGLAGADGLDSLLTLQSECAEMQATIAAFGKAS